MRNFLKIGLFFISIGSTTVAMSNNEFHPPLDVIVTDEYGSTTTWQLSNEINCSQKIVAMPGISCPQFGNDAVIKFSSPVEYMIGDTYTKQVTDEGKATWVLDNANANYTGDMKTFACYKSQKFVLKMVIYQKRVYCSIS